MTLFVKYFQAIHKQLVLMLLPLSLTKMSHRGVEIMSVEKHIIECVRDYFEEEHRGGCHVGLNKVTVRLSAATGFGKKNVIQSSQGTHFKRKEFLAHKRGSNTQSQEIPSIWVILIA